MPETVPSICRICLAFCPIMVTVEDGRAVKVAGDPEAREYEGYTCPKGRALPQLTNAPDRLLHSVKRQADGTFAPIASSQVVDEVAVKLRELIDRHGPRSIAIYFGNGNIPNPFGAGIAAAIFQAVRSPMIFTPSTIDKPAEKIVEALHGHWIAGGQAFEGSDTWMLFGANPVIAKSNGVPFNNPGMRLKQAVQNGMKLIVVDPRRTETAKRAHVHLQARPGEDPTILAGMIRIIIEEGLYDRAFVKENAQGLDVLKAAVAPFTPDYVAARADIPVDDLLEAARTFGRAKRGMAMCATGPSFSLHGNLSFYLTLCLNTLCGRWGKAGETAVYPNVLLPAFTPKAQPLPPYSPIGKETMRVFGLTETASGMPTAALPDEILLPGEGQVKALICVGSNPVSAFPDQRKTEAALKSLELLVSVDVTMSGTAQLAHYVVAPTMQLEQPALTYHAETVKYIGAARGYQMPWAQYAPAATVPPKDSDLIEEHVFFFKLAQALGLKLNWTNYYGIGKFMEAPVEVIPMDMSRVPTLEDLFELATRNSRVPLSEVKTYPHGHKFDINIPIAPRDADCTARLELAAPEMIVELAQVHSEQPDSEDAHPDYPFRLITRRANNSYNSIGTATPGLLNGRHNPAYLHPSDLSRLGLKSGDLIDIRSRFGEVVGVVEADAALRRGMISMTHGFGARGAGTESDPYIAGSNVNLLMSIEDRDALTGLPRMSALPVAISRRQTQMQAAE